MSENGTRIDITPELHWSLKDVYEEQQFKGIKGVTLKKSS